MGTQFVSSHGKTFALGVALTLFGGLVAPFTPTAQAGDAQLFVAAALAGAPAATSTAAPEGATELSPTPPNDTQAVPPNILVTFDDSGSMAFNYMGDNRPYDNGSWSGPWRCAGVIDPSSTDGTNIRSKPMNGVYYNPNVIYAPPVKADGSTFPNADKTLQLVPQDGIGVNRPYNTKTLDSTAGYHNNPNLTVDTTRATDLTGTLYYPKVTYNYVSFGNTCPADADANSCSVHTSGTNGKGSNKTYAYWYLNANGSTGSGSSTIYYGTNLATRNSSSGSYSLASGDNTSVSNSSTAKYVTWTAKANGAAVDNRWQCGYGASPMDPSVNGPDGKAYPNGGPYYYRYKASAPTIAVDVYGKPTSAGLSDLYNKSNWEAVAVRNEDVTINGQTVNQWQNFANWYAYYRARNLMTRTSLSRVFGAIGGPTTDGGYGSSIRVAWQNLNDGTYKLPAETIISNLLDTAACAGASSADPSALQTPSDTAKAPGCYRSAFFNWIFETPASGGTPSVNATNRAGKFFLRGGDLDPNKSTDLHTLRDPYWEAGKVASDGTQQAGAELYCRQNFHMLVTDGLFNSNSVAVTDITTPPQSSVKLPDGTTFDPTATYNAIFQGVHSDNGAGSTEASISDLAFSYWATNLRPDLYDPTNSKFVPPYMPDATEGVVATSDISADSANSAHVNNEIYFNPKNDPANWPHLVQYMVGLGVSGVLNYSSDSDCVVSSNSDACLLRKGQANSSGSIGWPTPADPNPGIAANIDDTWHAALAGRGNFFSAGNPQNLVDQLSEILTNISARSAPAETGAINTSVLVTGALGFNTGYSSADWSGTLLAVGVNTDGTTTTSSLWDAGDKLDHADPTKRDIFTSKEDASGNFDGGVSFTTFSDFDSAGQTLISGSPASVDGGTNDTGQTRVDYLRGDRTKEGTTFRSRNHLLGAIIGSQTVYVTYPASGYRNSWPAGSPEQDAVDSDASNCGASTPSSCHSYEYFIKDHLDRTPTVYVGANDGMLHAFDASLQEDADGNAVPTSSAGKETFAYVPRSVYGRLGNLTRKDNFNFLPTVDGIPVTRDVFFQADTTAPVATTKGWHTILVGSLRLGGRGIFALDITDPSKMSASKVLWEFNADQPDQGSWPDGAVTNPGGKPSNLGYTFGQPNIGRLPDGRWVVLVSGGYFPDCSKAPFTASNCSYPAAASHKYSSLFVLDAQTGKLIREITTPDPDSVAGAVASHGLSTPVLGDYNDDQIDDVAFAGDLDGNLWRYDLSEADPNSWSVSLAFQPATPGEQPITSMPRLFADPATNKFIVVFGTGKYLGVSDNTSGSAATQAVYGIRDLGTTVTIDDLVEQTLSEKLADDGKTLARGLTDYAVPADKGGWYFNLGPSDSSAGERVVVTPGALFNTGRAVIQTLIPGTNDPCSATIQGAVMVVDAATGGSGGGLTSPSVNGWGGGAAGDTSTVGGRVNNPRTGGSLPLATTVGGGTVLIPGLKLSGGSILNINDAVWRRRSWREIHKN